MSTLGAELTGVGSTMAACRTGPNHWGSRFCVEANACLLPANTGSQDLRALAPKGAASLCAPRAELLSGAAQRRQQHAGRLRRPRNDAEALKAGSLRSTGLAAQERPRPRTPRPGARNTGGGASVIGGGRSVTGGGSTTGGGCRGPTRGDAGGPGLGPAAQCCGGPAAQCMQRGCRRR